MEFKAPSKEAYEPSEGKGRNALKEPLEALLERPGQWGEVGRYEVEADAARCARKWKNSKGATLEPYSFEALVDKEGAAFIVLAKLVEV